MHILFVYQILFPDDHYHFLCLDTFAQHVPDQILAWEPVPDQILIDFISGTMHDGRSRADLVFKIHLHQ
jgi:hypothetical protein